MCSSATSSLEGDDIRMMIKIVGGELTKDGNRWKERRSPVFVVIIVCSSATTSVERAHASYVYAS